MGDGGGKPNEGGFLHVTCPNCREGTIIDDDSRAFGCDECGKAWTRVRGMIARLAENEAVRRLAGGPQTDLQLTKTGHLRSAVQTIEPPNTSRGGQKKGRISSKKVYHLAGQERTAMSLFIDENEDMMRDFAEDPDVSLKRRWDEYHRDLFYEQWEWLGYASGTDGEDD